MKASLSQVVDPLARFTAVYQEIARGEPWWEDKRWLRFAAQTAVLRPADPVDTAHRIKEMAAVLRDNLHWHIILVPPWNLVTAATLVQHGDSVESFTEFLAALRHLLQEARFLPHGSALIKLALALRILLKGKPVAPVLVERIRRLYYQMRDSQWWLPGKEEAPVCALLAELPKTPEEIAGIAEGLSVTLRGCGCLDGIHLRTATKLLMLSGKPTEAAGKFADLCAAERARGTPHLEKHYEALALLSLLDHDAERIGSHLDKTRATLNVQAPALAPVNFSISSDLVFLDLARSDSKPCPMSEAADIDPLPGLTRLQRAATLALV